MPGQDINGQEEQLQELRSRWSEDGRGQGGCRDQAHDHEPHNDENLKLPADRHQRVDNLFIRLKIGR